MSVEVIKTVSPNTNEVVITRNGPSAGDIESLPKTSAEAFKKWSKTTLAERQDIIRKALKNLSAVTDELALELTTQMGRPIAYGAKEVATAISRSEYLVNISEEVLKDTDGEPEKGFKRFIRKVPVGPVLVLFAWNVSHLPQIPSIYAGRAQLASTKPNANYTSTPISSSSTHSSRHFLLATQSS